MENFITNYKKKPVKKNPKNRTNIPWVEKYRPKTIDDVAHQTEVVAVLRKCLENGDLPNLLFYGRPGTGKTSVILALAHQLFGPLYSERVLELNASDERGIGVVRDKIKAFAHVAVSNANYGKPGAPPPYKLIILDEADSMTAPAQAALRRTMETEMRTTRFCLTCNYVTRIIDPISSRCAKFRFRPLDNEVARNRLRYIADAEKLSIEDDSLTHLLGLSRGDLRQAITLLQSAARLRAIPTSDKVNKSVKGVSTLVETEDKQIEEEKAQVAKLTVADLEEVASVVPDAMLKLIVDAAKTHRFDEMQIAIKNLLLEGHSAHQTVCQLHDVILTMNSLTERQRAVALEALAVADVRLIEGADEYLQILAVGGVLMKTLV